MGDGRYYTFAQFTTITLLLCVMIFLTVLMMVFYYRSNINKAYKRLLLPNALLIISVFFLFCEACVVSESTAYSMRAFWLISLLSMHILVLVDLTYPQQHKLLDYTILSLTLSYVVLRINFLITEYSFISIHYSDELFIIFLTLILINIIFSIKNYLVKKDPSFLLRYYIFWILPLIVTCGNSILQTEESIMVLCILSICNGIFLYQTALHRTPYTISSTIFSNIRKMMTDYIYITNASGEIIYVNDQVKQAPFLIKSKVIHQDHIEELFNHPIEKRYKYNKTIIKYEGKKDMYFNYKHTKLNENSQVIGHITTLIDITELIDLLDQLKEKESETIRVNRQLSEHEDIVYDIEKEKEISKLLGEISEKQEKSMTLIKDQLINLRLDDHFEETVTTIINKAKKELENVRTAVTAYMNYYN